MYSAWVHVLGLPFAQKYYMAGRVKTRCVEAGAREPLIL